MAAAVAAGAGKEEEAGEVVRAASLSPRTQDGDADADLVDGESPYPIEAKFFGVCPLRFIEDSTLVGVGVARAVWRAGCCGLGRC